LSILAFDPGINGGCAVVDELGDLLLAVDTPTIGEGSHRRIDAVTLASLVQEFRPYKFAVVEQVGAMPKQGVSSMFRFGQSYGTLFGVLGALAIPVRHVSPAKWKKSMNLNSDAEESRAKAIETWPDRAGWFTRKKDHNRAEAAILALWGLWHSDG
jgi:crossover junction endodeoxyribonuclease RuvC